MIKYADMHVHTISSDGDMTAKEVVLLAKREGIKVIALTDHDTINYKTDFGVDGVRVISGIEFSTLYKGKNVHILGYFVDGNNKEFKEKVESIRVYRRERIKKILKMLKEHGIELTYDEVTNKNPNASFTRMHIARLMVNKGYVKSTKEAYDKFVGDDAPCFVPPLKLSVKEAVYYINKAGGISVLAHPGLIEDFDDYEGIIKSGVEGIEVFYPKHNNEQREFFYEFAKKHNLLISGGSDFHSKKIKGKDELGLSYLDENYFNLICEHKNNKDRQN